MQAQTIKVNSIKSRLNQSRIGLDPLLSLNLSSRLLSPAIKEFQDVFLYGTSMRILHKGRAKEMFLYLDSNRQNFLWISSKTKAFILDLYFTEIHSSENGQKLRQKLEYFIILRQFQDEVVLIFNSLTEKNKYFNLFRVFIHDIRKKNSKYTEYFSLITRMYALEVTKDGSTSKSEKDILNISHRIGLINQQQNEKILHECCRYHSITDFNQITFQCVSEYFNIQFCSRSLQKYFQNYSQEKLGLITENPRLILKQIMSVEQFKDFLREQQKESEQFIQKICQSTKGLSFFDFCSYIYDKEFCSISCPPELDQAHPLTHYFCFSSHNTYLSGNQLTSDSKVERYTEDLQRGIKCVELDVHNDGNIPIITHAVKDTSLCSTILFSDVIKEIDRFSEQCRMQDTNHYPIILSIQNHASELNREKMLNILMKHFHDSLYLIDGKQEDFPTLKELKGKIIIKTSSKESELKKVQSGKEGCISPPQSKIIHIPPAKDSQKLSTAFAEKMDSFMKKKQHMIRKKGRFDEQMISMENLFLPISSMTKITSIFKAPEGIKTVNPSSFCCTSLTNQKVLKTPIEEITEYSKRSWLRTYPTGTEIYSSNYDPIPMLRAGAQIIALNTQTKDENAWIMYGYFCGGRHRAPGSLGYVLKPASLRPAGNKIKEKKYRDIKVKIIQKGHHKIKMKFHGMQSDKKHVQIQPDIFTANNLEYPDEGFLLFDIDDKYRDCVGLKFIASGFRILEGRNISTFLDCGIRIIVHVTLH